MDPALKLELEGLIRDVPDFPQEGILFKDITPLLENGPAFNKLIGHLADRYRDMGITRVVGIESRGFIFGAPLACALNIGLSLVRKPGKLPYKTRTQSYTLEYGTDTLEIHEDTVIDSDRVIIVDDLLATGGTAAATLTLVKSLGAEVVETAFLVELDFLKGREKLGEAPCYAVLHY